MKPSLHQHFKRPRGWGLVAIALIVLALVIGLVQRCASAREAPAAATGNDDALFYVNEYPV